MVGHRVRFYDSDVFLVNEVDQFLARGLREGASAVVIATAAHREALQRMLASTAPAAQGNVTWLDARETLARFMVGNKPDPALFHEVVGQAVTRASAPGQGVLAFGEMVAILWDEGNPDGALQLEALWNDLATTMAFTLLCAYPLRAFASAEQSQQFQSVCDAHTEIMPAESLPLPDDVAGLRRVATLLQQKAYALEAEARHREMLAQRLADQESELSDVLENAVEGIHKVGADGRILWANRAELELMGYTAQEYIGRSIADFHVDAATIRDMLDRLLAGKTLYNQPARLRRKDGSIRHVLIHSNARFDDGQLQHTRCFTRDVTDRVLLDEERQRWLEELAANDRRKDEFLATLAHELRNPLAPMAIALEMLQRQDDDGAARRKHRSTIERQVSHMTRLVEDLLDVARISRGKIQLRKEPVAFAATIVQGVELARPLIEQKGHRLTLDIPERPLQLDGDPVRLAQVVGNLLQNAAKYTPPNGSIAVALQEQGPELVLTVTDTGIGLADGMGDRIFDLFVQGHARSAAGGLGIGLTLVRAIVEMHGGTVRAESDGVGRGSRFTVRLPHAGPAAAEAGPVASTPSPVRTTLRVLVVDDNPDIAESLADMLRSEGHEPATAADGPRAVVLARARRPDVVLCDIGLPGMDGYEVAQQLRQLPASEAMLLIALSGYAQDQDRHKAALAGFDHHMAKPPQVAQLLALVNGWATRKAEARGTKAAPPRRNA